MESSKSVVQLIKVSKSIDHAADDHDLDHDHDQSSPTNNNIPLLTPSKMGNFNLSHRWWYSSAKFSLFIPYVYI